jgi:hypothetical protein
LIKSQNIEAAFVSLGIDSASITRLALYSDGFDSGSSNLGIILSGSYKAATVINNVQSQGWSKQDYKGIALYSNPSRNQYLSALKGNLLVIGTRGGVEGAIDVALNPRNSFTRQKPFNRMARESSYPITIAVAMSQEGQDIGNALLQLSSFLLEIADMGPLGAMLNTIGFARALSCSVSRRGPNFSVEIMAVMKDEKAASIISGSLNMLKGTSKLIPRERLSATDRETFDRFHDLQITRNAETLSIKLNIPETELFR